VFLVDPEAERLVARMDDGREQVFERDELAASKLAYGYATTVHRSQGATCERAHVYEDGGGRELAYVAMSRAREETHVYLAADDIDQAREDLARSWATERRWQWAIDTGTPELDVKEPAALKREALVAEQAMLDAAVPAHVAADVRQATHDREDAARNLDRTRTSEGLYAGGELGRAAEEMFEARWGRGRSQQIAENKYQKRSVRREARHQAAEWDVKEQAAKKKVAVLFDREERRLTEALEQADRHVGALVEKDAERDRWFEVHPEVPGRLKEIGAQISRIDSDMDHERRAVVHELYPELELERQRTQERSRSYDNDRSIDRDDFGFGL